jgi:hypothetical protein
LDVLRIRHDVTPGTSSPRVPRLRVDIRVQVRDTRSLWLLIGDDTFPSGVNQVTRASDGAWWFEGGSRVEAIWLGPLADVTFTSWQITGGWTPFVLGVIEIGGTTPQEWVQQGGQFDRRSTRARVAAHIDVVCATWVDLRETSDPRASGSRSPGNVEDIRDAGSGDVSAPPDSAFGGPRQR